MFNLNRAAKANKHSRMCVRAYTHASILVEKSNPLKLEASGLKRCKQFKLHLLQNFIDARPSFAYLFSSH